jgi:Xaa-Pro aminopeptidase
MEKTLVAANIQLIKTWLKDQKLSAFYFSSSDIFLNEYVPLEDCHRYYVTNFTGSTAEVIIPQEGKVILFVDGRYYEQADLEVDTSLVEVVKVPQTTTLKASMLEMITTRGYKILGTEGDRLDLAKACDFRKITDLRLYNNGELENVLNFVKLDFDKKIIELDIELVGESTADKLSRILKTDEAIFISALDSIAWLTNLRRYELPFQSTFRAKALATRNKVYLLLEHCEGEINNASIEKKIGSFSQLEKFLRPLPEITKIYYSDTTINASDFEKLKLFYGEKILVNLPSGINDFQAFKNPVELQSMLSSFDRADKSIFETIASAKKHVKNSDKFSELDFYHECNAFYKNNGAVAQSFNTIAGFGANSSIIHFSGPSADVAVTAGELMLLDSGGYFESGYATDTTRSFFSGGTPTVKQKEIYTLVLKSLLHAMNAVFPVGTWGSLVDGITRQPMFKFGYNYNHGTGHGVGINVHESGYRVSMTSNIPLRENNVGSLEPGIYIPGFGGVRLENVVVVEKHPTLTGMLYFRSLVFVGYDHELIEKSIMTQEELDWLEKYERECAKKGRSFIYN